MKKLLLCLALLFPMPALAAVAFVQSTTATPLVSTSVTLAFGSNTTAGNMIIVAYSNFSGGITTPTDSQSNTYTLIQDFINGSNHVGFYVAFAASSAADTITSSGFRSSGGGAWTILEYSFSANPTLTLGGFAPGLSASSAVISSGISGSAGSIIRPFTGLVLSIAYDGGSSHTWTNASVALRANASISAGGAWGVGEQSVTNQNYTYTSPYTTTYTSGGSGTATTGALLFLLVGGGGGTTVINNFGLSN